MYLFTSRLLVCFLMAGASFFASGQYCGGGPSSNVDSNVETVQITGVASSINHVAPCPGVLGVQNLTALSVTLNAGALYHLFVEFGTCNGNYAGAGQAWIDFNQNNIFEPGEALGSWSGTPPVGSASDFAFTVPFGAANGVTRMRVTQQEGGVLPLNPCAAFTWGSVMDFTVIIQNGVNCSGYTGDIMADAIVAPSLPYLDTNNTSICYNNNFLVYSSPDVYYKFYTTQTAFDVHISTCNSTFDTYISLLDKNGNLITYNDDGFTCGTNSDILFSHQGADTFYVVVEGWNLSSGQYQLLIEQNSGLGTHEIASSPLEIYPNPANDYFTIQNVKRNSKVFVYDMQGRMHLTQTIKDSNQIDILSLPAGTYLVSVEIPAAGTLHYKLIIQR